MPDEGKPDAVEQDGIAKAPAVPALEQQAGGSHATNVGTKEVNEKIENLGDELHKAERWMIWLTGAIAFFGLCTVVVGVLQWNAMKGQLQEMHSGGIDTHNLAEASGDAANAASDQADAAQQFSDTAEDINSRMSEAVDQLGLAANNAKNSIRATQVAMRLDQRAWVGVQDAGFEEFAENKPIRVMIVFFNSGKTPAVNVQSSVRYRLSSVPLSGPSSDDISKLPFHAAQSISPQGRFNSQLGGTPVAGEPVTLDQMAGVQQLQVNYQNIKDRKLVLYFFGVLKYDDVFGKHRETQYCIYLADPETKRVGFCDEFNDLN